jgi:hypothetical protein
MEWSQTRREMMHYESCRCHGSPHEVDHPTGKYLRRRARGVPTALELEVQSVAAVFATLLAELSTVSAQASYLTQPRQRSAQFQIIFPDIIRPLRNIEVLLSALRYAYHNIGEGCSVSKASQTTCRNTESSQQEGKSRGREAGNMICTCEIEAGGGIGGDSI